MNDETNETSGISRRDLIKKGAIAGGTLLWAVPVVETLGQSRAFAAPSGSQLFYCCYCYKKLDANNCDKNAQCNFDHAPQSASACDNFCQSLHYKAGHYEWGPGMPNPYSCNQKAPGPCGCFQ